MTKVESLILQDAKICLKRNLMYWAVTAGQGCVYYTRPLNRKDINRGWFIHPGLFKHLTDIK